MMQASQKHLTEPHESFGAFVSLFNRLIDDAPGQKNEYPIQKFYSVEDLKESIHQELVHILGTHCKFKEKNYQEFIQNPLNYGLFGMFGIPNLFMYDETNKNHWRIFARQITKVITVYEPRLTNILVTITGVDQTKQFLNLTIFAHIIVGKFREEATFSLRIVKRKR